jgi:hypothetical protein
MVLDRFLGVWSQLHSLEIIITWQTAGRCPCAKIPSEDGNLVVQDNIEEGAVHVDATVVLHEAELPELIHEETHP